MAYLFGSLSLSINTCMYMNHEEVLLLNIKNLLCYCFFRVHCRLWEFFEGTAEQMY